jgi:hypothetical protein
MILNFAWARTLPSLHPAPPQFWPWAPRPQTKVHPQEGGPGWPTVNALVPDRALSILELVNEKTDQSPGARV